MLGPSLLVSGELGEVLEGREGLVRFRGMRPGFLFDQKGTAVVSVVLAVVVDDFFGRRRRREARSGPSGMFRFLDSMLQKVFIFIADKIS